MGCCRGSKTEGGARQRSGFDIRIPTWLDRKEHDRLQKLMDKVVTRFELEGATTRKLFRKFDPQSYGKIRLYEFKEILRDLDGLKLSEDDINALGRMADRDGDDYVNYQEFFEAFFKQTAKKQHRESTEGSTLRQVIVIARHGARFPLKPFPGNVTWPNNPDFWSVYGGKLTPTGNNQHVRLGKMFHEKYIKNEGLLLEDDSRQLKEQVFCYTSNQDRTLNSAQSFFLGFLPSAPQCFVIDSDFQDGEDTEEQVREGITIHMDFSKEYTPILHGFKDCPNYAALKKTAFKNGEFDNWAKDPEVLAILDRMWKMTQFKKLKPTKPAAKRLQHFQSLAQQIAIERAHRMHLFLNKDLVPVHPEDETWIRKVSDYICRLRYQGLDESMQCEMSRLASGTLPTNILSLMDKVVNKAPDRKRFILYSAHDNTIMALLSHLGFRDWPIPQFAGHVGFELHYSTDLGWYVKLFYNAAPEVYGFAEVQNRKSKKFEDLETFIDYIQIPSEEREIVHWKDREHGPDVSCPWEEFVDIVKFRRKSLVNEAQWKREGGYKGSLKTLKKQKKDKKQMEKELQQMQDEEDDEGDVDPDEDEPGYCRCNIM